MAVTPPDEVIPGDAAPEAGEAGRVKSGEAGRRAGSECRSTWFAAQFEPDEFSSDHSSPDDNLDGDPADPPTSPHVSGNVPAFRLFSFLALAVIVGAAAGMWYGLPIKEVQIQGQSHLTLRRGQAALGPQPESDQRVWLALLRLGLLRRVAGARPDRESLDQVGPPDPRVSQPGGDRHHRARSGRPGA